MATYRDTWDLRAGFTKDFDLATSAVKEADRQFADAQKIIDNAYSLDRTAATQGLEIQAKNQLNMEKILESQSKIGDFESAAEIQRALETLGDVSLESPTDQQPRDVQPTTVDESGQIIEDPRSPIVAAPNVEPPPQPQAQRRPMTRREKLVAIEPTISNPRTRYKLREMIQKESTAEAAALHTIAPDEAFNMLLKEGIIKGQPLIANDDGTYSRRMPDGRNTIRLDRAEAAAFVGDTINKTNNSFKIQEEKYTEGFKSGLRNQEEIEKARLRSIVEDQKFRQQRSLEGLKSGNRRAEINLRADRGLGVSGGGSGDDDDDDSEAAMVVGAPVATQTQVQKTIRDMTPTEITTKLDAAREGERKARESGNRVLASQYKTIGDALAKQASGVESIARTYDEMFNDGMKEIASTQRPLMQIEYTREIQQLKKATNDAIKRGESVDARALKKKMDDIVARAKAK